MTFLSVCVFCVSRKWLAKSDIYTLPHVVLFDSLEHLVELLESTDLARMSARIREAVVHAGLCPGFPQPHLSTTLLLFSYAYSQGRA
jgi:hypothetical protein